jgi:hypothetical protein
MGTLARILILVSFSVCLSCGGSISDRVDVSGPTKLWHPITLTLQGSTADEESNPIPFLDHRLLIFFDHPSSDESVIVPGYFAADGNAAETGATSGNRWRTHFVPDKTGTWKYRVSFRTGDRIALDNDPMAGEPALGDGTQGEFTVEPGPDEPTHALDRGKLQYVGERYLRFPASEQYFLKSGADSPENFLAYAEFDGAGEQRRTTGEAREGEAAVAPRHSYDPHVGDWDEGDPTWREGNGKGIIGALNYLSSKGVNSLYFLTMNIRGDGDDVWPYSQKDERYRFDCSKLDQWNVVFDHMDTLGMMLHFVLTETENESLFESEEGGTFADARKIYYRELISRFGHHNAITWNIGEENGWNDKDWDKGNPQKVANTDDQRKAFASYIRTLDPYDSPVVVHTLPGRYDEMYEPLLGYPSLEGPSLQMGKVEEVHQETLKWVNRSREAGRPWFVCLDEIGPASTGVKPDADDPDHYEVRRYGLWGNLMAGGAGCEWYFGYEFAHNDLNLEDFRSRDRMWDLTRFAVEFFQTYLPFEEMHSDDSLVSNSSAYCFAKPGEVYAIYLGEGGTIGLSLPKGTYSIDWFDPRNGGPLQKGSRDQVTGAESASIGDPPTESNRDWVALVRSVEE